MKFFRTAAACCSLSDHERRQEVLEQLEGEPVDEKLGRYKLNWLRHATGMDSSSMAEVMLSYRPSGPSRRGRSLKRLLDEAEAGL